MTTLELTDCLAPLLRTFKIPIEDRPDVIETYYARLGDFTKEELQQAIDAYLDSNNKWPLPFDLKCRIPSFIPDDLIALRILDNLRYEAECGPSNYNPVSGSRPKMNRCDPEHLMILEQVGGVDRLWNSLVDAPAAERLKKDFVKACTQSVLPLKIRAAIKARQIEGAADAKVDLLLKDMKKEQERKQLQAPTRT